jgi:hypothetical protein
MCESRDEQIKEAQRLRNLGRFPEAAQYYCKAQEQDGCLLLSVELAGMFLEQGCPKRSLAEADDAIERFAGTASEPVAVALAELLRATTTAATTVRFHEPLEASVKLYNRYLLKPQVEEYDKHKVRAQPGIWTHSCHLNRTKFYVGYDASSLLGPQGCC